MPPASPRRSTTASIRSRRSTPTSTACATCSTTRRGRREPGRPVRASCSTRRSEIYGDPAPDAIPTPETYRGLVSCTGPRACYDESKRFGETLCVIFAQQYGVPVTDGAAVQQLRPGPEDHRRPRDPGLRARHPRRPRHRHALRRHADAHVLLRGRRDHRLLQGAGQRAAAARPTTSASRRPRSRCASWPSWWSRPARELFGYKGKVVLGKADARRDYLVDNPNRRCPIIDKARDAAGLRPEVAARRRPAPLADLVPPQPDGGGRLMRVSIIGTGYVGLVTGACLPSAATTCVCVDVDPAQGRAHQRRRARRSTKPGSTSCSQRTSGRGSRATTDLRAAVRGHRDHVHRRRARRSTASTIDLQLHRAAARADRRRAARQGRLPRRRREEHGRAGHHRRRRARRRWRQASGQAGRASTSASA